jgi:hypothetical protein
VRRSSILAPRECLARICSLRQISAQDLVDHSKNRHPIKIESIGSDPTYLAWGIFDCVAEFCLELRPLHLNIPWRALALRTVGRILGTNLKLALHDAVVCKGHHGELVTTCTSSGIDTYIRYTTTDHTVTYKHTQSSTTQIYKPSHIPITENRILQPNLK